MIWALKLAEDGGFREIGQWWDAKAGRDADEIDIVGIHTDNKTALVAEVKRQKRNYDHKAFMTPPDHGRHVKTSARLLMDTLKSL